MKGTFIYSARLLPFLFVLIGATAAFGQGSWIVTTTGFGPTDNGDGTVSVSYRGMPNSSYEAWVALKNDAGMVVGEQSGTVMTDAFGNFVFNSGNLTLASGTYKICATMRLTGTTGGDRLETPLTVQ